MVDMTEEEKMMLRRLIVKEDELEEVQMELDRVQILQRTPINLQRDGRVFMMASLEARRKRLSREVEELREKLEEVCGE